MISVIIPALDEENAIETTIDAIRATFDPLPEYAGYEIILVDDGSQDRTADLAEAKGARVIRHPANAGYGRSLKDGIAAAHHELVAITDADCTYPVDRLPDLCAEVQRGFHMAVGERTGEHYRESALKAPMRKILRSLVEFTTGSRIPDINSGLRVFRKSDVMPFFPQLCNTFSFTTSMTLAYMLTGKFITYHKISYAKRIGTTKVRLFHDSMRTMQYIVQAIIYYNPIKLFIALCGGTILFSLLSAAVAMIAGTGGALYLLIGGILLSVLVFSLGLLADLLRQIMTK